MKGLVGPIAGVLGGLASDGRAGLIPLPILLLQRTWTIRR